MKNGYKIEISPDMAAKAGGLCFDLLKAPYFRGVVIVALDDFEKTLAKRPTEAISYLAHECVHAANAIIASRDLVIEEEASVLQNDEIQAYLVSYLVEQMLLKVSKKKPVKTLEATPEKKTEKKFKKSSKKFTEEVQKN